MRISGSVLYMLRFGLVFVFQLQSELYGYRTLQPRPELKGRNGIIMLIFSINRMAEVLKNINMHPDLASCLVLAYCMQILHSLRNWS